MSRFKDKTLLVASHNKGKIEEIAHLLEPYGVRVTSAAAHGLSEPEETETTFVGNARIKAHYAAKETGLPALADDSGLEVLALDGAPGVYTADWAETPTGRDFEMAMVKVHDALIAKGAERPWRARFCCTLVLAWPDGTDMVFPGTMKGQLVWPMRGSQGHGYDPMFQPDGYAQTFGEMDRWEKNKVSHRADAFRKLTVACFSED
ncbi:nucleoside-triphosphatase [Dinoroseobacter shibae DFL 12 = DSM 16493]|jgi:XTP/dITP diphosphohydrolase|uniref:dITP/XTP pyrophosphatase n=1 Tax=Dinoroseobacter shibae (strain DSM 16493 / NCIMB 14021 / DFL 12) TaxID=398580 RepID=A8LPD0_DINSH|nr:MULTISPECIES: RdgB/HAM1 family non-canonical purine NTP pyrophosphatase [Dinoroseobacter]ABV95195.1 nucleoside-triphosphatase [Dinoroseobacter shibae DFL 12 = DSM 16493]MDD9718086.1 RdgB/HAM1 family non-canonical purine NTP pyrophosphatase [Dinoroseobacter sp. PD6]URF46608.1 RdgB/HAM1 family non-canonical purine NTP pyrophosphatase [Dinoroseobacter shibae]URF50914.1 RdgB/HAM1 family non-canonical purine NTP pyrophosphatase [Dinoroseobacter shibae]